MDSTYTHTHTHTHSYSDASDQVRIWVQAKVSEVGLKRTWEEWHERRRMERGGEEMREQDGREQSVPQLGMAWGEWCAFIWCYPRPSLLSTPSHPIPFYSVLLCRHWLLTILRYNQLFCPSCPVLPCPLLSYPAISDTIPHYFQSCPLLHHTILFSLLLHHPIVLKMW